jgi:hypothetical protein
MGRVDLAVSDVNWFMVYQNDSGSSGFIGRSYYPQFFVGVIIIFPVTRSHAVL